MSSILVQVIVGGLLLGAVYALFSSGLTLIWGMMNIVNFAHGDFVMLGMYAAFAVWTLFGVGPFVGAPVAALVLATLGVIGKKFSQMKAAYLLVVGLQRLPRLPLRQRFNNLGCRVWCSACGHIHTPFISV